MFYDGSGLAQTFQSIDSYKRMTNKNDNITTVWSEILTARHKPKHTETQKKKATLATLMHRHTNLGTSFIVIKQRESNTTATTTITVDDKKV